MIRRNALIAGIDPEITVHGAMPALAESVASRNIAALDLRADREKFGDLANPRINNLPARLAGHWWKFNSVACSVDDAIVDNRIIYHAGLPVIGAGMTRWEQNAAVAARAGTLVVSRPDTHLSGRTGLLLGRSAFNYYHFISDVLVFLEDLVPLLSDGTLERVVINPCRGDDNSFQRNLVRSLYPDICDRVVFSDTPFSAEHLSYVVTWPQYYEHGDAERPLKINGIRGVARRAFRDKAAPFLHRADTFTGVRKFSERTGIVLISRQNAPGRRMVNEDALFAALAPMGARRISMETLSTPEQMELMAGARVVIGPHGAGMVNCAFCQTGALCIELTARHYLTRAPDFASIGIVRDVGYVFAVCDEEGDIEIMKGNVGNDIRLSADAISRVSALVAAARAADDPAEILKMVASLAPAEPD